MANDQNYITMPNQPSINEMFADEVEVQENHENKYMLLAEMLTNRNGQNVKVISHATFYDKNKNKIAENVPQYLKILGHLVKKKVREPFRVGGNYHGYVFYPIKLSQYDDAVKVKIVHEYPEMDNKKILKYFKLSREVKK